MPARATVSAFRPYTGDELERIAGTLADVYDQGEKRILGELAKGDLTDWGRAYRIQQTAQIRAVTERLNGATTEWAQHHLPTLYRRGMWVADGHLEPGGLSVAAHPGQWTPMDLGMTKLHEEAVQILAENLATTLGDANAYCAQRIEDIAARARRIAELRGQTILETMTEQLAIRDASLQTLVKSLVHGETLDHAQQRFLAELEERGVTTFIDKSGRQWDMGTYSRMVVETVCQETQRHGLQNRMVEAGQDLVQVSRSSTTCKRCAPWEGKILSITGKTRGYPTVTQACNAGLFHPRCRHFELPYIKLR